MMITSMRSRRSIVLLFHLSRPQSLYHACTPFRLKPAHAAGWRRPCCCARLHDTLPLFKAFGHTLKSHFTVGMLRAAFSSCHHDAGWTMGQADARLNLIAVLATGSAGNKVFSIAIAFQ